MFQTFGTPLNPLWFSQSEKLKIFVNVTVFGYSTMNNT